MTLEQRSRFVKKLGSAIEQLSDGKLVNSPGDYEVELRLIANREGKFFPALRFYTLPDHRFAYRKHAIAASMHPSLAALIMELAAPYLKENAQIIDPFCGVGTMLIERDIRVPAREKYGTDIFGEAIDGARENAALAGERICQSEIHKDTVSPLQVMSPSNTTSAPEATTEAYVHGILDKEDTDVTGKDGYVMTLGFYDDLGYSYTAKFAVSTPKTTQGLGTGNNYFISLSDIIDSKGNSIVTKDENGNAIKDEAGKRKMLDSIWGDDGKQDDTNGPKGYYMKYDSNKGTFVSIGDGSNTTAGTKAVTAKSLKLSALGTQYTTNNADGTTQKSNFKDINVDFSTSTNVGHGGKSTLKVEKGTSVGKETGKKNGAMIGLAVDQSGKIYASYDNGNTELLGQIAVAQFANASGLEKIGDNCYQTTLNSGEFDGVGVAVDADGSKINSGQLEMSNVDLSGQFTDMIITQRGFQANSRVITVSDTLLEELINLKR